MSLEDRLLERQRLAEVESRMAERRQVLAERCAEEGLDRAGN